MNLPASLRKYADKIQSVEDLRDSGEGYWVHLKEGWRDWDGETHSIHEDTIVECAWHLKRVQRCTDPKCCKQPE